jgi:hypothetical protein
VVSPAVELIREGVVVDNECFIKRVGLFLILMLNVVDEIGLPLITIASSRAVKVLVIFNNVFDRSEKHSSRAVVESNHVYHALISKWENGSLKTLWVLAML